MTSLANIYSMEKALVKLILGNKLLFVNQFSKFLQHLVGLLEKKKHQKIIFVSGIFRTR